MMINGPAVPVARVVPADAAWRRPWWTAARRRPVLLPARRRRAASSG